MVRIQKNTRSLYVTLNSSLAGVSFTLSDDILHSAVFFYSYLLGIVGLYDSTHLNQKLASRSLPLAPSYGTPLFAMNRNDVSGYRKQRDYNLEKQKFKPWLMENIETINPCKLKPFCPLMESGDAGFTKTGKKDRHQLIVIQYDRYVK